MWVFCPPLLVVEDVNNDDTYHRRPAGRSTDRYIDKDREHTGPADSDIRHRDHNDRSMTPSVLHIPQIINHRSSSSSSSSYTLLQRTDTPQPPLQQNINTVKMNKIHSLNSMIYSLKARSHNHRMVFSICLCISFAK